MDGVNKIRIEYMENEIRDQAVKFGNYLLSNERKEITSEECQGGVTHADVENYLYLEKLTQGKSIL
jgi:hypothetical protein